MATIVITNLTANEIFLRDLGTTIGKSGVVNSAVARTDTITVSRPAADIEKWLGIAKEISNGSLTMSVTLSSDELKSGIANDYGAVSASSVMSDMVVLRMPMVSGGAAGAADDVVLFAAGAVPSKLRILDVAVYVSTAVAAATATLRTAVAGGGAALSSAISVAAVGVARNANTATAVVATTDALVVRRSDRSAVGEVVITARREA